MLTRLISLVLTCTAFACVAACTRERIYDVTGTIRSPLEGDRLVIQHAEIPGYMPAMTMAFTVADRTSAATLRAGDQVEFRFRVGAAQSLADGFRVTGRETLSPSPVPAPAPAARRLRAGDRIVDFALIDERGERFTAERWRGQLTVITFIFTRCPVPEYCPAMALRFGEIQTAVLADPALRERVQLYGITLDPDFDQPDILRQYGEAVGARREIWRFATGDATEVNRLTRAFAVYTERNGVTLDHSLTTALVGADGTILELWRGNGWKSDEVLSSLRDAATPRAPRVATK